VKINEVVLERRGGRGRKKTGKGTVRNTDTGTPSVQSPVEKQEELQAAQAEHPASITRAPLSQYDQVDQPAPEMPQDQPQQQAPQQPAQPNLWDRLKKSANKVSQGVKNFQQTRANAPQVKQGQELAKRFSQRWLTQWNQTIGADPSSNTPEGLQDFMARAFSDKFSINDIPLPEKMDPAYVAKYIQTLSGKYIAEPARGKQSQISPSVAKAKEKARMDAIYQAELEKIKAGQQAYQNNTSKAAAAQLGAAPSIPGLKPRDIASAMANKGALGNIPQGTQQEPKDLQPTIPGVKIVNQDPIIIDLDNKRYGLDDRGQWIHLKSGKVPPESIQALLSKQHDTSLGL
jgi:hypothetical protein